MKQTACVATAAALAALAAPSAALFLAAPVRTARPARIKMGMLQKVGAKIMSGPTVAGVPIVPVVGAVAATAAVVKLLDEPQRHYDRESNTVGKEYDEWTEDGILEHYWGEHIHLGWYSAEEMEKGYKKKGFIQAKYDFIDRMMEFSNMGDLEAPPAKVLDVGCGIGGTSRYLANKLGDASHVTGITLSPKQVARATKLAAERGLSNTKFEVMDALNMKYESNTYDMVWACESGEHMPDKKAYIEEMTRVLKPGGVLVVATWCQRDNSTEAFTDKDLKRLNYLYSEWTHPHFISIKDYADLMEGTGALTKIHTEDWWQETIASWRHSIWVGVFDPWPVARRPWTWYKTLRDGICLERFHRSFDDGLMGYGMFRARKRVDGHLNKYVTK